jgi:hypothetical protein
MKRSELRNIIREEVDKMIKEAASTTDEEVIKRHLQNKKDGIYMLKGGVLKGGGWNFASLDKAKPLFYTPDFDDPKLKDYEEDGIVKIDIDNGEIGVSQY